MMLPISCKFLCKSGNIIFGPPFIHESRPTGSNHYPRLHLFFKVSNFLLFKPGANSGSDLPTTDINRGLDSGVPPYNNIREACGLKKFGNFDEFADEIMDLEMVNFVGL